MVSVIAFENQSPVPSVSSLDSEVFLCRPFGFSNMDSHQPLQ